MDAGVMQDIDVYPATDAKAIETLFHNSSDYIEQLSSINFWDDLDRSADSSFVNSAAASVSLQTPSTAADSPASTSSLDQHSHSACNSHKHKIAGRSAPRKRRCSDNKKSKFSQDPSTLDCSDYWLRFDSDNESLDPLFEDDTRESSHVSSPEPALPLSRTRTVGRPGSISKVALPLTASDLIDDSALDHALSDEDDLFSMALAEQLTKNESAPVPSEVPPRERLYSTPLSWEPPQPGYHMDYMNVAPFSDPERQRLLAIALGTGQSGTQAGSRPATGMDFHFEIKQSPTTMSDTTCNTPEPRTKSIASRPAPPSRTNSADAVNKMKEKPKNNDRAAHNDIERKYRTNLKDKIAELRDAIPSLRSLPKDDGDKSPVNSSRTAPKGTVLTKATEYIHQLERRNRSIAQKNDELARRLQAFEQLVGAVPGAGWQPQGYGQAVFNPRFS
ncbi:Uu.00g123510.m01.CDS01 [Anthostomella pinea]|uniref:Uu.00g123510.m01.CDS01 n=1 Tax=Anthostomella pinea TaxID=933095 RepID=A0AAI8VC51_9PEZI|nr:Uu.00g123510.m01.CDS01 [Anthostomella pinea]